METIVKCDCNAESNTHRGKVLMPHTGHVSCEVCGAVLESWLESPTLPHSSWCPDRKPVGPDQLATFIYWPDMPATLGLPSTFLGAWRGI